MRLKRIISLKIRKIYMQSMIKRDLKNFRHMSSEIDELNATELVKFLG